MATFADVVERVPAAGRIYLPTASYQEMGEWALPHEAGRGLEEAKRDLGPLEGGARLAGLLRGGFWRNFLVKYPEVADFYWKMLRLSRAIEAAGRGRRDPALAAARESLWRGQANDAYWHGVFGGCYLPHLRRAVKSALLDAEARLVAAGGSDPVTATALDPRCAAREGAGPGPAARLRPLPPRLAPRRAVRRRRRPRPGRAVGGEPAGPR